MNIRDKTKKLANDIRTKTYASDVRETIATGIEQSGNTSQEARDITESLLDGSYDTGLLNTEIERRMNNLYSTKGQAMDDLYTQKNTELTDLYINEKSELDTLQADYADRAETLETTYAPRLTSVEQDITTNHQEVAAQLAQTVKLDDTGVLGLNVFDEPTRNVLQGQEVGTINAVLGVRNVKTINVDDKAITEDKVSFIKKSSNEFDKNSVIKGFTINARQGEVSEYAHYSVTPFVRVNPGDTFCSLGINRFTFYKSDNSFLSDRSVSSSTPEIINVPVDAVTMRLSVQLLRLDTAQYNRGTELLPYEEYYYHIDERLIPNGLGNVLVGENELWESV